MEQALVHLNTSHSGPLEEHQRKRLSMQLQPHRGGLKLEMKLPSMSMCMPGSGPMPDYQHVLILLIL